MFCLQGILYDMDIARNNRDYAWYKRDWDLVCLPLRHNYLFLQDVYVYKTGDQPLWFTLTNT